MTPAAPPPLQPCKPGIDRRGVAACLAAIYVKLLKNSIKSEHIAPHGRKCTRKMGVRAPHVRLRRRFLGPSARPKPTDLL